MKQLRGWARLMLAGSILASQGALAQVATEAPGGDATGIAEEQSSANSDNAGRGVEEIVVTAQKREESLQRVPITITAITAAKLATVGVTNTQDLVVVTPGLNVSTAGQGAYLLPNLRGIGGTATGPGIENSVPVYVDGVYLVSAGASLLSLNNIERVEVLKGPQGTLFGRNATGGLVHIITRDPKRDPGAEATFSYGNYDTIVSNAYITGGSGAVAADLAVTYMTQGDGYGRNIVTGADVNKTNYDYTLRSKLLFEPSDTTTIRLSGDYSKVLSSTGTSRPGPPPLVATLDPSPFPGGDYDTRADYPLFRRLEAGGGSVRIDQELGSLSLVNITAYRRSKLVTTSDVDGTFVPGVGLTATQYDRQFTNEIQLLSSDDGPFKWLVGAFYLDSTGRYDPLEVVRGGPFAPTPTSIGRQVTVASVRTKSYAAFAQATYAIAEGTNLTGGIRYTEDRRRLTSNDEQFRVNGASAGPILGPINRSAKFSKVTYRASLDHQFTPDVLGFISYNRGFKSGGFNATTPLDTVFKPEVLDSIEGGVKADLIPGRLRLNASAFHYKYKDIQIQFLIPGAALIRNGSRAKLYGADFELVAAITDQFRVTGGLSLLHDRFSSYPDADYFVGCPPGVAVPCKLSAKGNRLPGAPDMTGNITVDYSVPLDEGRIDLSSTFFYNDGFTSDAAGTYRQDSYGRVSASIGYFADRDRFSFRVWGRNLNNSRSIQQFVQSSLGGSKLVFDPPRTYGFTAGMKF